MCCEGQQVPWEDVLPKELQDLRKSVASGIQGQLGKPASQLPEGLPISTQVPQPALNAMQMINQMMGFGDFQNKPPISYDFDPYENIDMGIPPGGWPPPGGGGGNGYEYDVIDKDSLKDPNAPRREVNKDSLQDPREDWTSAEWIKYRQRQRQSPLTFIPRGTGTGTRTRPGGPQYDPYASYRIRP